MGRGRKRTAEVDITPSTKLEIVSVSKVETYLQCLRKYYWTYVRNLRQKSLYVPFFLGDFFHRGLAALFAGEKVDKVVTSLNNQITEETQQIFFAPGESDVVEETRVILEGMMRGYAATQGKFLKSMNLIATEVVIRIQEEGMPVPFRSKIDSVYQDDKDFVWCVENKTSSKIDSNYITRLPFDFQTMLYPLGHERTFGVKVRGLVYNIIRKPSIRQRQDEEQKDFVKRLLNDYQERVDFYYYQEKFLFNSKHTKFAVADLIATVNRMWRDYHSHCGAQLDEAVIIDQSHWPRNSRTCFAFGRCPFMSLCRDGETTAAKNMFIQRELRYEEEFEELSQR